LPALTNPRHERFAQELAKGKSADEAYQVAGYKADRSNAAKLTTKNHVLTRVAELVERGAIRAEVTLQSLIDEAEEVRLKAIEWRQGASAIAAIKEKGVLTGLRVEKSERKNINDTSDMADDELADIARTGRDGAVAAPQGKEKLN
jgi:phage terminase small subunit